MTINIGNRREFFWDDFMADKEKTTAVKRLGQLKKCECALKLDKGEELISVSYPHLVKHPGGYRLYYLTCNPYAQLGYNIRACVQESTDGINWTRPELDICPGANGEKTNIIMENLPDNMFVFYDTNPACPKGEKFKALVKEVNLDLPRPEMLWCYVSEDGFRFKRSHMVTDLGHFDTLNTASYRDGKYYCFVRSFHNIQEGVDLNRAIRDIRMLTSEDFRNWTEPVQLEYNDSYDYGMYTNNILAYERAPHIFVGFPTRYFIRDDWTKNAEQMASIELKRQAAKEIESRDGLCTTDAMFMCSRDALNWTRYNQSFLTPGYENDHNWVYGDCYLTYNMMDFGDENYSFYCHEYSRNKNHPRYLYRYEIRKDGFVYYEAGAEEQVVVTKPLTFEGKRLHLNFETSPFGHIFVEVLDESGNPVSGRSFEIYGNTIDRVIEFEDGKDFSEFEGKPVRLRFTMLDAKLYSLKFD